MSLQRCMAEHTSTELILWMAYLDRVEMVHRREDYYFAQLTAEVRRGHVKNPRRVKAEDFLLKFETRDSTPKTPPEPAAPPTAEEAARLSKAIWGLRIGAKDGFFEKG